MNTEILGINIDNRVITLLNKHKNRNLVQVATVEEAIEKMHQIHFDVVVAPDARLESGEEAKLKKLLSLQEHDSMWITYTEGHENDLEKEIAVFLQEKETAPNAFFSITDDGFKRPDLTIEIL